LIRGMGPVLRQPHYAVRKDLLRLAVRKDPHSGD